jgi:hypothetical protein
MLKNTFAVFRVRTTLLLLTVFIASFAALERCPAMKQNVLASAAMSSQPQIDMRLPKELATATFAMG